MGSLVIRDYWYQCRSLGSVIVRIVGDQGLLISMAIIGISDSWDRFDQLWLGSLVITDC